LSVVAAIGACGDSRGRAPDSIGAAADSGDRAAPTADRPTARRTILFVGTSLTAGQGLPQDDAFPAMIQERLDSLAMPFEVVNAGSSGETTSGLLSRLDWLLRGQFDVLVLETGANDGLRGIPPETVRANLDSILTRIRRSRPAAVVALVQMEALPNYGPRYGQSFHQLYVDLAAKHGVALLPFLLDGVAGHARLNQSDGIHPNLDGERIVADNIWKGLRPLLEGR
jgi:acyl-CoA thioesterase-1